MTSWARQKVVLAAGCASAALVLVGCYESRPGARVAQRDGGARDGARDLDAGLQGMDAGLPGTDAGLEGIDGGAALDAARDGGGVVLACTEPIAPYDGLGCATTTRACIAACPDSRCAEQCIVADRECLGCIDRTLVSCANRLGCEEAWIELACCAQAEPPCAARSGIDLLACADACDEIDAYDACVSSIDTTACAVEIGERCML